MNHKGHEETQRANRADVAQWHWSLERSLAWKSVSRKSFWSPL